MISRTAQRSGHPSARVQILSQREVKWHQQLPPGREDPFEENAESLGKLWAISGTRLFEGAKGRQIT